MDLDLYSLYKNPYTKAKKPLYARNPDEGLTYADKEKEDSLKKELDTMTSERDRLRSIYGVGYSSTAFDDLNDKIDSNTKEFLQLKESRKKIEEEYNSKLYDYASKGFEENSKIISEVVQLKNNIKDQIKASEQNYLDSGDLTVEDGKLNFTSEEALNDYKGLIDNYNFASKIEEEKIKNLEIASSMFSMVDYNSIKESTENDWEGFINNLQKTWKEGGNAFDILMTDAFGKDVDKAALNIAERNAESRNLLTSKVYDEYLKAETVYEKIAKLKQDPFEIMSNLVGGSFSQLLSTGRYIIPTTTVAGAGVGSGVPVVGTIAGAGYGLNTGMSLSSFTMEYGGSIMDAMRSNVNPNTGKLYDVTNPQDIEDAFMNKDLMSSAREKGIKRGIAIGAFDLMSGFLAGRVIKSPTGSSGAKRAAYSAADMSFQAGMEGAGEMSAQLLSEGKVKWTEVFDETIGGFGGEAPQMAFNIARKNSVKKVNEFYEKLNTEDGLFDVVSNEDINSVNQFIDKSGKVHLDKKDVENIKSRLAIAKSSYDKIPSDLNPTKKKEAFDLLYEKANLSIQIEGKDQKLVNNKIERIAEIDKVLEKVNGPIKTVDNTYTPNQIKNVDSQITTKEGEVKKGTIEIIDEADGGNTIYLLNDNGRDKIGRLSDIYENKKIDVIYDDNQKPKAVEFDIENGDRVSINSPSMAYTARFKNKKQEKSKGDYIVSKGDFKSGDRSNERGKNTASIDFAKKISHKTNYGERKGDKDTRIKIKPIINVEASLNKKDKDKITLEYDLNDISLDITSKIGVYTDKANKKAIDALGLYKPSSGNIRMAYEGDMDTLSHEIGHFLDDTYGLYKGISEEAYSKVSSDLKTLSEHGSNPPDNLNKEEKNQYRDHEGIAEFIRSLIVNPENTKKSYPALYQYYQNKIPYEVKKHIFDFSDKIRVYEGMPASAQLRSKVKWAEKKGLSEMTRNFFKNKNKNDSFFEATFLDKLNNQLFSTFSVAESAIDWAKDKTGKELPLSKNPAVFARMLLGKLDMMEDFLMNGLRGFDRKLKLDKGNKMTLDWLVEPFEGMTRDEIKENKKKTVEYMISNRILEKINNLEREKIVNDLRNGVVYISPEILEKYNLTDEYGESNQAWKEDKNVKRILDPEYYSLKDKVLVGISGGFFNDYDKAKEIIEEFKKMESDDFDRFTAIKKASDRYRKWANTMLEFAVEGGYMSEEQFKEMKRNNQEYVSLNRLVNDPYNYKSSYDFEGEKEGSGIFKRFEGSRKQIIDPYKSLFDNTLKIITETTKNHMMMSFVELLNIERGMSDGKVNQIGSLGFRGNSFDDNTTKIKVNGETQYWIIDEQVLKSFESIYKAGFTLPYLLRLPGLVMRATITNFPVFSMRNNVRDTQHRLMVSRTAKSPLDVIGSRKFESDWKAFGGGQGGYHLKDENFYYKAMDESIKKMSSDKDHILMSPINLAKKGVEFFNKFNEEAEKQNRLAEYKTSFEKAKNEGMDDYNAGLYAMYQSRDLLDFAIGGETIKVLNQLFPFTNAHIQGLRRSFKQAKEKPVHFLAMNLIYGVIPVMMARAWNEAMGKDDEYEDLPDYKRDLYFNIATGLENGPKWISIPKPHELSLLGAFTDRSLSYMQGNKNSFDGYSGTISTTLSPFDKSTIFGPYKAVASLLANKDSFRNKYIIPPYEEKLKVENRKGTKTGSVAGKIIQDYFGIDSRQADFFVESQFGYFGRGALKTSSIGDEDSKYEFNWADIGFFYDEPIYGNKTVHKVFDKYNEEGKTNDPLYRDFIDLLKYYSDLPEGEDKNKFKDEIIKFAEIINEN